ncbi:hypothetical protein E1573_21140 [Pseudomonas sp. H9]|nr:hypothetical protein E1573_21140 [Pseudomonas sp. H9]
MMFLRRIVCRRFGASICLGARSPRCKNDRGIAESVKPRQRAGASFIRWWQCLRLPCSLPRR